ncbi:uncharacterized protein LOC123265251 [Cotesia glomerata]|nr:uncharacterized protein LOC123265251 [Cotesia glomerata]
MSQMNTTDLKDCSKIYSNDDVQLPKTSNVQHPNDVEPQKGVYKMVNKFYADSMNSTLTTFADLYVNDDNIYFTNTIPLIGRINTHFRVRSLDKEHAVVWSCEDRGSQHIESGWVFTATPRTPSADFEEKIRRSFTKFGLQVPEMHTHNLEECRKIFATY